MNKLTIANTTIMTSLTLAITGCQVENPDINGGKILLYTTSGEYIDAANVGNLPDMVKFVDSKTLVSANEGEPESDYSDDPEGSISIIKLAGNKSVKQVTTLGFSDVTVEGNVRVKPGSTFAADLEPEYVAVSEDGKTAWVSLQENNAVAIVDLEKSSIKKVKSLDKIEWNGTRVDISDDGIANPINTAPNNIFALYMPDTMVSYNVNGTNYFISANEGDDRDYDAYVDLEKANKLTLSDQLESAILDTNMKKLRVLTDLGVDESGIYSELYMTGTRSFTIWDADANVVFDSGSMIEDELANNYANSFNTRVDDTDDADDIAELDDDGIIYEMVGDTAFFWEGVDARSLKKGAEPEALAIAKIDDKVFAYVGLEKQGGFMSFDITNPIDVSFIQYFNDIDYTALPTQAGDLAPEGMVTFQQDNSNYLAIANELSSTVALFELANNGTVTKLISLKVGSFGEGAAEILDYSPEEKALYVTNGEEKRIDIIDVSNPIGASVSGMIDFSEHADSLQSVSVKDGIVAIAVE
jgi:DNA-binding beta-propeller fold protein YncE